MKMANNDHCCPQSWTLAQILAHMDLHQIEVIAVLTGQNGTSLVGIITKTGLQNAISFLRFDASEVTAQEVLSTLPIKRI